MLITSIDNKNIKEIKKLREKKYSITSGLFVIEGDHAIREAISRNLLVSLYLLEGNNDSYNFNYDYISEKVMKSLSDLKSLPRVIGVCKIPHSDYLGKKIVILDKIQDPGNAGTIIRNCVAFGVDTIIFSKDSVSAYNEKVIRSTEGMIFHINIITEDLDNIIDKLNVPLIGSSLHIDNYLSTMPKFDSFALLLGSEGSGVNPKYLDKCKYVYKIKMNEECESLNVGVSCGIILYKLFEV